MLRRAWNRKGFTLVELLIVIAIIGIIASIAIPQFVAYRQKSYNAMAKSDLHNARVSLEGYYYDYAIYPH